MEFPDEHTPPAGGLWCYNENITGEAATDDDQQFLPGMFSDYCRGNPFDLPWQQGGAGGDNAMFMDMAAVSGHSMPPPVHEPEVLPADGPPENEMASWLSSIVRGDQCVPPSMTDKTEAMSTTKDAADASRAKSKAAAEMSRRRHQGEAHNLTEKKRRCKINERLKTLQQLVPGCDKQSNHASTLEQTIQYLKWLQHLVQAKAKHVRTPAATTPAAYPVVLGQLPMVSYRPLVPCAAHYPAPAMLVPAAAPLYPIPAAALPPATSGADSDSSHRHGAASSSVLKRGRN
ncbi:hypothetical protein PR202_gb24156 [Eleusine coracana subsp. coracana]|uniref:BHLH domain-containing protein n=1 Tax=Eleusine coracana subsp. coracana TaxID=191504 RepID=A0AAV5FLU3_ELECO|nr:hypothetical protein PR202_gb24156 [Eleusine coracana subsp. coracana]